MTTIMPSRGPGRTRLVVQPTSEPKTSLLGQTAEYALRAMAHIAAASSTTPVTSSDLAQAISVPLPYLSKVLRKLVTARLLVSQKGHRGGFVLAKPARTIRFIDVLVAVDRAPSRRQCAFGWGRCDARHPCPLHPAWDRLGRLFVDWTEDTTLADIGAARPRRR